MHSRASKLVGLATLLVLAAVAFAAQAEDEGDRLHRHHKALIHHGGLLGLAEHKGGFLGVQLTELTPELRAHFGVPEDVGVMISKVVADSPAERAGLRVGDIITRIDGDDVGSARRLQRLVGGREEAGAAVLEIWRDGGVETVTAELEVRERGGFGPGRFVFDCDGEDCDFDIGGMRMELLGDRRLEIGCGDAEDCDFRVTCSDGDCECLAGGEEIDCEDLHLKHGLHGIDE